MTVQAKSLRGKMLVTACRVKKGWSIREAAEIIGIHFSHLWKIEHGYCGVGIDSSERFEKAFGKPARHFQCKKETP